MAESLLRSLLGRLGQFLTPLLEGLEEEDEDAPSEPSATKGTRKSSRIQEKPRAPRTTRVSSSHPVADAILAYDPVSLHRPAQPMTHAEFAATQGLSSPKVRTEREHSNAFLFGVISDRMIKAEKAWQLPYVLSERLGHLDLRKISRLSATDLEHTLRTPTNLHRFNKETALAIIAASKHVLTNHDGAAFNMWPAGTSAPTLLEELEALPGISHKLSSMTLQILITRMGVDIRDMHTVNVAVDRHVARVFLRTGLVKGDPSRRVFRAGELKPSVIEAAKDASPKFPGALDFGAFWIGKNWCTHTSPRCVDCPIRHICPQDRRDWSVGVLKKGKVSAE